MTSKVRRMRLLKLLKQYELAKLSGVSVRTLCVIERGGAQPRWSTLEKLASVLNCSPHDIDDHAVARAATQKAEAAQVPGNFFAATSANDIAETVRVQFYYGASRLRIGGIDKCKRCSREYTVSGGRQKYCKACLKGASAADRAEYQKAYYEANKEKIAARRKAKREAEKIIVSQE